MPDLIAILTELDIKKLLNAVEIQFQMRLHV